MSTTTASTPTAHAEAGDCGRSSPAPGSAGFSHPRYMHAVTPSPGDPIDSASECADCGYQSADFGRFRKAERYERADADGEIYECGYCGCTQIVPPLPNTQLRNAGGGNPAQTL